MVSRTFWLAVLPIAAVALAPPVWAADVINLVIKDHQFTPAQVNVPAGVRFRIEVANQDDTPAEFESSDLRAEKIAVPGGSIAVLAGPLKPGTYKFFDDYHPDTAVGTITAAEPKG